MTVIEADAIDHAPLAVDSIQIFAGQRYSFVLVADQAVDNYWIRALPNKGTTTFDGGINSAILRYAGAPAVEPSTNQTTSTAPLAEADLVPLDGAPAPGEPSRVRRQTVSPPCKGGGADGGGEGKGKGKEGNGGEAKGHNGVMDINAVLSLGSESAEDPYVRLSQETLQLLQYLGLTNETAFI